MNTTNLVAWLPFVSSATADECNNLTWTAYGTTSISNVNSINGNALQVNKGYLRSNETITFGGADFTVSFYAYVDSTSKNWATPFAAAATLAFDGRTGQITLRRVQTGNDFSTEIFNSNNSSLGSVTVNNLVGAMHHFEYDYTHSDSKFRIFIDGELKATQSCSLERLARYIFIGANNCRPNDQCMVGSIDEFQIYDGIVLHTKNFTPPTADDYLRLALEMDGYAYITLNFDVERVIKNNAYIQRIVQLLKVWLPFDESTTEDLCDNTWTAYGTPTIEDTNAISGKALQLSGGSYVMCTDVTIGEQDFTIDGWCYTNSSSGNWARVFEMVTTDANSANILYLAKSGNNFVLSARGASDSETQKSFTGTFNQRIHFAVVYQHEAATVQCYINGQLSATITNKIMARVSRRLRLGKSSWSSDGTFIGTIDEFQIYDGVALHTANFTLPTDADYTQLKMEFGSTVTLYLDTKREIVNNLFLLNCLKVWLPFNSSVTEDLCGNEWTTSGSPVIEAEKLVLNGSSYLKMTEKFEFTGQPFTIACKFSATSNTSGGNCCLWQMYIGSSNRFHISITTSGILALWKDTDSTVYIRTSSSVFDGQEHHVECDFDGSTWYLFLDGNLIGTKNHTCTARTYTLYVGTNYSTGRKFTGTIDEFIFFDGIALHTENFDVPKAIDYVDLGINLLNHSVLVLYVDVVRQNISGIVEYVFDSSRTLTNTIYHPSFNGLKAYLPFDNSVTEDLCGNEWTAYGNLTISTNRAFNFNALQLDGSSYLKLAGIKFGGRDFYIDFWVNVYSSTPKNGGCVLYIVNPSNGYTLVTIRKNYWDATKLDFWANYTVDVSNDDGDYQYPSTINSIGFLVHVKLLYCYDNKYVRLYINDEMAAEFADCPQYNRQTFDIYVGTNSSGGYGMIGTIDELRIYDGVYLTSGNSAPPTFADYVPIKLAYYGHAKISFNFDVKSIIKTFDSIKEYWKYLKVWLSFDNSVTEDLCGHIWSVSGNPTISSTNAISNNALQLDGSSYLLLNNIELGGQDFTIDAYVNMSSSSGSYAEIFYINDDNGFLTFVCRDSSYFRMWYNKDSNTSGWNGSNLSTSVSSINKRVHIELIYYYSAQQMYLYIDGVRVLSRSVPRYTRKNFRVYIGNESFIGSIDEFRIFDGIALHNADFTPPSAGDYELFQRYHFVTVVSDVARKINNFIEVFYDVRRLFKWRYKNTGIADLLSISGTTLTDLPETQSRTGTAFYQTQSVKCFDLPATNEVWMKFDVYFDGTRWFAFNGGANGTTGIASWESTELDFRSNNAWVREADFPLVANQLQTVLLHMISDSSAGVIEVWVDEQFIYRYTGDVNHGQDFEDLYLRSNGSGTFFSNVIISNYEIGLDETLDGRSMVVSFDVEISISRLISLYLDVKRIVITQKVIEQLAEFSSALKVWLPFDTSPIADVCSNEWVTYGSPTIQNKELVLVGSSCLKMYPPFTITRGQTFTVGCWFSTTSNTAGKGLWLWSLFYANNLYGFFIGVSNTLEWAVNSSYTTIVSTGVTDGKEHYLEVVFDSGTELVIALDGVRVAIITESRLPNYWVNSSITTLDYKVGVGCNLSYSNPMSGAFIGMIDEFQIYDGIALHGENFIPPIEASYTALRSKILENSINVLIDVMRLVKDDTVLKVHLTFDEDVTTDECGNVWSFWGHPTISEEHAIKGKALQLDGESYLDCSSTFTIEEGQPFTIDCWVYAAKAGQLDSDSNVLWSFGGSRGIAFSVDDNDFANNDKQVYHCALVSDGLNLYRFIDGTLTTRVSFITGESKTYSGNTVYSYFDSAESLKQSYTVQKNDHLHVGYSRKFNNIPFTGTIDEFRLIIGDALWTESFTPSITGEILDWTYEIVLNCDVVYIVNNVEEPWIYYNIGVTNGTSGLVASASDLPANVSRTGYAIYGEYIRFSVPVTSNFWIRFDFNPFGTSFFGSEYKSKKYGVDCYHSQSSRTTALLYITCDSYYGNDVQISGNATSDVSAYVLHSVLLHIKSGLTDGVIEAWVDKTKSGSVNYLIERYVGNVNDGVPIYDFYLYSGSDGSYFSNIIISNEPITFDSTIPETHIIELILDVECQITSNFVTYNLDIIRNVIAPIIIPFSGENIEYTLNRIRICSIPQKFILPKISKFYICGDLVGKVHIYSDTNVEGIINGSYYFAKNSIQSEFIESNEFYIVLDKSIISAQDVIKLFIHKLVTNRLIGTPALNRAVIYATDGRYVSWDDFINQFLNCLNSIDYKRFLNFYCDINLDNDDTGAILGWDAGGVAVRTAISVVTESSSTNTWKIPVLGSSIMISNLLVHFPQDGVSGDLTNLEKYILFGLNSEWIYRSLELIKYSFGISFEDSDITYEMYIRFSHDSSSGTLAYTSAGENDTSCILTINMYYYNSMDITDVNGLSERANLYLDRTIVHELVHAVMELISYAHGALPEYIIEGLAELVHGIDDFRKNNIVELLTTRKNDLISALTSEQYAYPEDAYSAGYILLRFLAKQGQHINNTSSNKLIINNLLVVNDLSLVIKTVQCDVTIVINNYVITHCDVTTSINNYVITHCDVTINHYMIIEYVLDVYCVCVVSIIEFISVQINVMCLYTISADVFRRIIGLNVTKFNIMMYGVRNVHINSVVFNIVMYGVSSSISSSIKFVIVNPSKTRTKLHQCIKPVVMLMLKPINNIMIADQVSDLALRSTPLYPDRSNKGYNTRG